MTHAENLTAARELAEANGINFAALSPEQREELASDAAGYAAWEAAREAECGAEYVTGGSDPYGMRCELPKGHAGQHTQSDAFGPESGPFTWGRVR